MAHKLLVNMNEIENTTAGDICDTPLPSQRVLRPSDSGYVNIDRLAEIIARMMGYSGSAYALEVVNIQNLIFGRARQGALRVYREDKLLPFHMEGIEDLHGGLRLAQIDADKVRADLLGDVFTESVGDLRLDESDPPRRLAALKILGGSVRWLRGEWQIKGISKLVKQEKEQKRARSDEKTIRSDLKKAAEDESMLKRKGRAVDGFSGI